MNLYGNDLFGEPITPASSGPVAERFLMPPFSVLDGRGGDWLERKRAWSSMGIRGEVGRSAKSYNIHEWADENAGGSKAAGDGTSIFDPVVCELSYLWFSPPGGQIVDPFAGGSVRGIVAGYLGRKYWGCDLRQEQIKANEDQADELRPNIRPQWVCGDMLNTWEVKADDEIPLLVMLFYLFCDVETNLYEI